MADQSRKRKEGPSSIADLMANLAAKKAQLEKQIQHHKTEEVSTKKVVQVVDPTIRSAPADRLKRTSFNFLGKRDIQTRLEKERGVKEEVKKEEEEKEEGLGGFAIVEDENQMKRAREPMPEVEWWDKWLLLDDSYSSLSLEQEQGMKLGEINIYVEHPIPIKPPGETEDPPIQMFLTKKEMKRLRKQKRAEREKERQERVIMGLEEAPAPKVKLSNLRLVLGAESSANPTAIENEVKRQTAERIAAHEARNSSRKLTKEQKKEKIKEKLVADTKHSTHVALFRIKDLSHPQHKYKVDVNAREHYMTGCAIISPMFSMVVVEGSNKSVRRFKKLMLHRIDWNKTKEEGMEEEKVQSTDNSCDLIWEGTLLKPNFQGFKFESHPTEVEVRKYLNNRWSEHYWDMCKNFEKEE